MCWDMRQVRQDNKCVQKFGTKTSQKTSISKTEEIGYRPNDQAIDVRFPAGAEIFISQTYTDYLWATHTLSCPVGIDGHFLAGKAVRV